MLPAGVAVGAAVGLLACLPATGSAPLAAQAGVGGPPLEIRGLLRTGLRFEPGSSPRSDGFEVFDARLGLAGEVGIVFDYDLQAEFDDATNELRLLDARLIVPFSPEVNLSIGQLKAPFGREFLLPKGDIRLLERAQASRAIVPGRQVGLALHGSLLEDRLTYSAGAFNGNGRNLENDDDDFLYAARVQYNNVGPIEFYEDLVIQVGGDLAYSDDRSARLDPALDGRVPGAPASPVDFGAFGGERFLWGLDLHTSYHGVGLDAEYLRGRYDADALGPDADALVAEGGYVEAYYSAWGAIEPVLRYDGLDPALGGYRDFLILGLNVYPGFHASFGLQYAIALGDELPDTELADGQFILLTEVDF